MSNRSLSDARKARNDEFYTQLFDIEQEMMHYRSLFRGKSVYCNCDDPRASKFFHYFSHNFEYLGLRKLVTTCYRNRSRDLFSRHDDDRGLKLEYDGFRKGECVPRVEDIGISLLEGDGDFRSEECVGLLKEADIVVTNPPFSLFREYVNQLVEHDKRFLIIGNKNAITYKDFFPLIKENRMWVGYTPMSKDLLFDVPADYAEELQANAREGSAYKVVDGVVKGRSQSIWFTNLEHRKRNEELLLYRRYNPGDYPKYDNYDAIEVSKVRDIPMDYEGAMGVPITFLDKYNPRQFEILDANVLRSNERVPFKSHGLIKDKDSVIGGKPKYVRVVIRNQMLHHED